MKFPRKMKKRMKKDAKSTIGITREVLSNETFFLHTYNRPLNRLINSLVYLNYPTRDELIDWWETHNPKDPATRLAKYQKDIFDNLEVTKFNISKGYMKAGKTLALTTILI